MPISREPPLVIATQIVAATALFEVKEELVRFSNGVERRLERIEQRAGPTVLVVPMLNHGLIMVREYCAGSRQYELVFPTGTRMQDETIEEVANRELREEIG